MLRHKTKVWKGGDRKIATMFKKFLKNDIDQISNATN